jgi:LysR family transcriptional regulator, nitrogen assimilation regulatory protein
MELRQLRYFVAVVESGSVSRAASLVHVVQPALSQQMGQLEQELGVQLLHRSVRGVKATPAGQALYRHAKQLLKLAEDTRTVVGNSVEEVGGPVKLGLPSSLALVLVGPLIAALERRFPRIALEVYESPSSFLSAHLINQQVDLSVLVDDAALPGIQGEPLLDELLYFVQPRRAPVAPTGEVELSMLAGVPLMLTTQATTLRHLVDRSFHEAGVVPNIKAQASSIQTLLLMVAQGGAGTIVPRSALASQACVELLQAALITPRLVRRATLAHSRLAYVSPAAACVREALREVARALVASPDWNSASLLAGEGQPGAGAIAAHDTDSWIS